MEQYWNRLKNRPTAEQEAFAEAERLLSEHPYSHEHPPAKIKHLKGEFHCNHEYRNLPNEQRIFYKVWTRQDILDANKRREAGVPIVPQWESDAQKGILVFMYAGPHPK